MSKLADIITDLVAKSAAVAGIGSTGILTDVGKMWAEETNPPAAYLGISAERVEERPTRSMTATALLFWHVITKADAPAAAFLPVYAALRKKVEDDPTLGGKARRAQVVGFDALNTAANIARRTHVADVFISVEYSTDRGTP